MELSIRVSEEVLKHIDLESAIDKKPIEIKGKVDLMSMHVTDGAIDKAFAKEEMFDNLIGMGLIDEEALIEIGYYSL
jgi:hypothetical protein